MIQQMSTATVPSPSGVLRRHPDFLKLWGAQTISVVGTRITELALPLTAIGLLGTSAFQVGLLAAAHYAPYLIIGLPAGVWVDRLRRRRVMIVADMVRFGVLLTVPIAAATGVLHVWLLFPAAIVVGMMSVFFDLASQAYLPTLVGARRLIEGNTKLQLSRTAGDLTGPGIGGILVQWITAPFAIVADAVSYVFSALALLLIRHPDPLPPRNTDSGMIAEIVTGLRAVFADPLLRPLLLATGVGNSFGFFGMCQAVLVLHCIRELHVSPVALGIVLGAGNAGMLAGSLLNRRVTNRAGIGRVIVGGVLLAGAALSILAVAPAGPMAPPVLATGLALVGAGVAVANINQVSLRQSVTEPQVLGRMTATFRVVNYGAIALGAALGGVLAGPIGLRGVLWLAAAGGTLAVVPVLLSPIRALHTIPAAA